MLTCVVVVCDDDSITFNADQLRFARRFPLLVLAWRATRDQNFTICGEILVRLLYLLELALCDQETAML